MTASIRIRFLDEDHVLRLARFALCGPGEIGTAWVRAFFSPEDVDPADVLALGAGLHAAEGVTVIPPAADPSTTSEADILIFRRGTIGGEIISASPKLRLIQRLGARADSIDLAAAAARAIHVSCLPRPTLMYTAEHTILLMLALAKRLLEADAAVRSDRWNRARVQPIDGVAYNWAGMTGLSGLYGRTLGIIGLGEVGAIVAQIARGFGMRVVYANRSRLPEARERELGVAAVSLQQLLAEADFVSLNAANLPENRGLINGAAFAAMKRSAFFINTSRGKLVDEDALYAALSSGQIAGAGLDVHREEPRPQSDRLATLPNIVLTPHCAGGSRVCLLQELREIFDNCRAVRAGRPPRHAIHPERRSAP